MKKEAQYVKFLPGIDSTNYDLGVYYLSQIAQELLEASYYSKKNNLRWLPEEDYGFNPENREACFIKRAIDSYIVINLSKLIDTRKDAWSVTQLLKEIKKIPMAR